MPCRPIAKGFVALWSVDSNQANPVLLHVGIQYRHGVAIGKTHDDPWELSSERDY